MGIGLGWLGRVVFFLSIVVTSRTIGTIHNKNDYSVSLLGDQKCGSLISPPKVTFDEGQVINLADSPFLSCDLDYLYGVTFVGFDFRGTISPGAFLRWARVFAGNSSRDLISLSRMVRNRRLTFKGVRTRGAPFQWLMVTVGAEEGPNPRFSNVIIFHALPPDLYGFDSMQSLLIELAYGDRIGFGTPVPNVYAFSQGSFLDEYETQHELLHIRTEAEFSKTALAFLGTVNPWSTIRILMPGSVAHDGVPVWEFLNLTLEIRLRIVEQPDSPGNFVAVQFRPSFRQNLPKGALWTPLEGFLWGLRYDGRERFYPELRAPH